VFKYRRTESGLSAIGPKSGSSDGIPPHVAHVRSRTAGFTATLMRLN
jgi:hypothetical protein